MSCMTETNSVCLGCKRRHCCYDCQYCSICEYEGDYDFELSDDGQNFLCMDSVENSGYTFNCKSSQAMGWWTDTLDLSNYDLLGTQSEKFYQFLTNIPETTMEPIFDCDPVKIHEAWRWQSGCSSQPSVFFLNHFRKQFMTACPKFLTEAPNVALEDLTFYADLFEQHDECELEYFADYFDPVEKIPLTQLNGCGYRVSDIRELSMIPELIVENDQRGVHKLMNWGNSRRKGCSIELRKGTELHYYAQTASWLRERYFPSHVFQCCFLCRGCIIGIPEPSLMHGEHLAIIMWKKREPYKKLYMATCDSFDFTGFDPLPWTMLIYFNPEETGITQNGQSTPGVGTPTLHPDKPYNPGSVPEHREPVHERDLPIGDPDAPIGQPHVNRRDRQHDRSHPYTRVPNAPIEHSIATPRDETEPIREDMDDSEAPSERSPRRVPVPDEDDDLFMRPRRWERRPRDSPMSQSPEGDTPVRGRRSRSDEPHGSSMRRRRVDESVDPPAESVVTDSDYDLTITRDFYDPPRERSRGGS